MAISQEKWSKILHCSLEAVLHGNLPDSSGDHSQRPPLLFLCTIIFGLIFTAIWIVLLGWLALHFSNIV